MLTLPFRTKLYKHGWLKASKDGGNPSQSLYRIKIRMKRELSDMVLLYNELPKDKRDQIFNQENFVGLFDHFLKHEDYDDSVKSLMAVYLVEKSLNYFKIEFSKQNKNTQVLARVINTQLDEASEICKDIVYKQKMQNIQTQLPKDDFRYLASWNDLVVREIDNLGSFLGEVLDLVPENLDIHYVNNHQKIEGKFLEAYFKIIFHIGIEMNYTKDKATLTVTHDGEIKVVQEFIVKSQNNDYLLYFGKDEIEKMNSKGIN